MALRLLFFTCLSIACSGPAFFSQKIASNDLFKNDVEILDDGVVKSKVYAGLKSNQIVELQSSTESLNGSSVVINPGALSISSNITLEPGADLLSGSFSSGLGLNEEAGIEGASEALLIEPEESVNPVGALVISIPLSSSALRLNGVIYSVLYEVFDYKNNRYLKGVIPTAKITIKDGYASFESEFFGNYQVVATKIPIVKKIELESDKKPTSKRARRKTPLTKLYKPTLEFKMQNRALKATLAVEDKKALTKCKLYLDIDKKLPYRFALNWDMNSDKVNEIVPNNIPRLSARLECLDKENRRLASDWSAEQLTPYNPILGVYDVAHTDGSGVNESGTEAKISWKNDRANSFKVAYQPGSKAPADCSAGSTQNSPYLIENLTANDTYSYRICALDNSNSEINSVTNTINLKSTKFVFKTDAKDADSEVKLYLTNPDVVIDWGDSNVDVITTSGEHTHTYASGTYTMSIRGETEGLRFYDYPNQDTGEKALVDMSSNFQGLKGVKSLQNLFRLAGNLNVVIKRNLFFNLSEVESFEGTFQDSRITGIEANIFDNNTKVKTFATTFGGAGALTNTPIPAKLFEYNDKVESFFETFSSTSFTGVIPEGLFEANPDVTTFSDVFAGSNLLDGPIPEKLFAGNPAVTDFSRAFYGATGLTGSIPEKLFTENPAVTSFQSTFKNATGLTGSIPAGLFASNPAVTSFAYVFYGASGLNGSAADIWANASTDFPSLNNNTINAFTNATSLTNRASIPITWGGDDCSGLAGEWVFVPGDQNYEAKGFSVMKYEAKNVSGTASSVPAGVPWASISQDDAKTECEGLGYGYGLMTNDQWMSIASNIAAVGDNWDGGTVGENSINVGHNDDAPLGAQAVSNPADPCSNTGETCDFSAWNSQRRTHKLSNGEVIWDISANLWEWTDLYISDANTTGPKTGGSNEYTDVTGGASMTKIELIPQIAIDNAWNSSNGIGRYLPATSADKGALARGGFFNGASFNGAPSGIFDATLDRKPDTGGVQVGFRCTYSQ